MNVKEIVKGGLVDNLDVFENGVAYLDRIYQYGDSFYNLEMELPAVDGYYDISDFTEAIDKEEYEITQVFKETHIVEIVRTSWLNQEEHAYKNGYDDGLRGNKPPVKTYPSYDKGFLKGTEDRKNDILPDEYYESFCGFNIEDIITYAKQERQETLDGKTLLRVREYLEENFEASSGICWDSIGDAIDEVLKE